MTWSVLIVDDDVRFRDGVKRLFERECDFRVAGEADDGIDAVEKAIKLKPDLIILDFYLPVLNGLAAAPALRAHLPEVTIIMLTLFSGGQLEVCARKAGTQALVAKDDAATVLIPTARWLFAKKSVREAGSQEISEVHTRNETRMDGSSTIGEIPD